MSCDCCNDLTPAYPWTQPSPGVYQFAPVNVTTNNSLFQPAPAGGPFIPSNLSTSTDPFFAAADGVITVSAS